MLSIKRVCYGLVEAFRTLKGCPLKDFVAGNRGVHVNYVHAQPLLMFFFGCCMHIPHAGIASRGKISIVIAVRPFGKKIEL